MWGAGSACIAHGRRGGFRGVRQSVSASLGERSRSRRVGAGQAALDGASSDKFTLNLPRGTLSVDIYVAPAEDYFIMGLTVLDERPCQVVRIAVPCEDEDRRAASHRRVRGRASAPTWLRGIYCCWPPAADDWSPTSGHLLLDSYYRPSAYYFWLPTLCRRVLTAEYWPPMCCPQPDKAPSEAILRHFCPPPPDKLVPFLYNLAHSRPLPDTAPSEAILPWRAGLRAPQLGNPRLGAILGPRCAPHRRFQAHVRLRPTPGPSEVILQKFVFRESSHPCVASCINWRIFGPGRRPLQRPFFGMLPPLLAAA